MQKPIFTSIIESDDLFEWSVEACLYASQKHDEMVIREAQSCDECTKLDDMGVVQQSMIHQSLMNQSMEGSPFGVCSRENYNSVVSDDHYMNEKEQTPAENSFMEKFQITYENFEEDKI